MKAIYNGTLKKHYSWQVNLAMQPFPLLLKYACSALQKVAELTPAPAD